MESIFGKTRQNRCFAPNNMIVNLKKIFKKVELLSYSLNLGGKRTPMSFWDT